MIAEKPSWIRHDGMQIFSIDIQPGGTRFATGGGDHKVRIWNLKSVGRGLESGDTPQRLLATLRDHFGSVNCVRWAKHGRFIASGSDDQVILIHERKPGSGTTEFGSGEVPDVENWKVVLTLRGHSADVVDLNWSPEDSLLASGSLDNTIHIWNTHNGMCTAVLRGHSSLVKGVAWDPIGSFIASQSDDKTVIIWRTSDWSLVHRTDGHWSKSLGSTFFRRLGWSPCGHFITTTHGFQKPRHSAPVLERGEWNASFDFLGHNAPIIVVQFNNSMFRRTQSNAPDGKVVSTGWTNGVSKNGGKELHPYNIIAIGSQDRTITVWTTASPRPLFVAKHFFAQSVVDLSWGPDGYSLFACSLDGSVATFHFEANELGFRLTDTELDELKRSRYGDVKGRQTTLAEGPEQLLLEAASAKHSTCKRDRLGAKKDHIPVKTSVDLGIVKKAQSFNGNSINNHVAPTGENLHNETTSSTRGPGPVKQREYRRPDGRKRIVPEVVGKPAHEGIVSDGAQTQAIGLPCGNDVIAADGGRSLLIRKGSNVEFDMKDRAGCTARAMITESLVVEKVPGTEQSMNLKASSSLAACSTIISIKVFDKVIGDDAEHICLEAQPREHHVSDMFGSSNTSLMKETEIICTKGSKTLWVDRISSKVTVLAGNTNFWAVGCEDGFLQIYTKCGRRALPPMMMGSSAVFIDCDKNWKLLLVTRKGSLYLWDLFINKCLLHNSLDSLITSDGKATKDAGSLKVISAKLSKSGAPLVVLATRHAFLFDMNLVCWLRVVDDCFPASSFASTWSLGSGQNSELASLQVDVRKFLARKPGWNRASDDGLQTRAHLEAQLASSLALKSAKEYRQCLLSYVRFLVREADELRLREVCESFLGPPTESNPENRAWDANVLGMEKRKLLREDILPAMAANRKVQRLLNEFIDLLSEYDKTQQNPYDRDQPVSGKLETVGDDHGHPTLNPPSELQ